MKTYRVNISDIEWDFSNSPTIPSDLPTALNDVEVKADNPYEVRDKAMDWLTDTYGFNVLDCGTKIASESKDKDEKEMIRDILRKYFETDPFTGNPSDTYDGNFSATDAIDEILAIVS